VKYLSVNLTAISPLAVRSDHAAGGAQVANYIPGTTLLGSLASTYRLMYPEKETRFEQLFLSGGIKFPNLYPATPKKYDGFTDIADQDQPISIYPCPKTAITCKRHKGFLYPEVEDNDAHGVRDTLIAYAIFSEWVDRKDIDKYQGDKEKFKWDNDQAIRESIKALEGTKKCKYKKHEEPCGEPTNRYDGYYRPVANKQLLASDPHKHLQTHTGINRYSGTVEEGILYNRQVFDEGTKFWGLIKVANEELHSELVDFLEKANKAEVIRMGNGRTRGMGKVDIQVKKVDNFQTDFKTFKQRLNDFNQLLQDEAKRYQREHMREAYYFALTLHAPVILNDELLRYRGTIDAETLKDLLTPHTTSDLKELDLWCVYQQAHVQRITGWQVLWGTPKTNEHAIEAGSVFLFKCPTAEKDTILEALYNLEQQGIGKRLLEGFGRVRISDEFHQEVNWL
jgi:CRISPR-associated protein Csx10